MNKLEEVIAIGDEESTVEVICQMYDDEALFNSCYDSPYEYYLDELHKFERSFKKYLNDEVANNEEYRNNVINDYSSRKNDNGNL